jgi:hypothetical protein
MNDQCIALLATNCPYHNLSSRHAELLLRHTCSKLSHTDTRVLDAALGALASVVSATPLQAELQTLLSDNEQWCSSMCSLLVALLPATAVGVGADVEPIRIAALACIAALATQVQHFRYETRA